MKKPKILIIGTTDCKGGAASVGWNIGESLRQRGYWVKYIVGSKFSDSVHVHELRQPFLTNFMERFLPYNITGLYRHFVSSLLANDMEWGAYQEILNHPWYKEADVIHFHNLHGSYLNLNILPHVTKDKKTLWTLHDMWAITGNCVYSDAPDVWTVGASSDRKIMEYPPMFWDNAQYLWQKKREIYNKAKKLTVVVPSKWLGTKVKESILKHHVLRVIYNGIDTKTFKPADKKVTRKKLALPQDKKIVTFIAQGGEHDPRKGWKYIQALAATYAHDPNIVFLCIGGGEKKVEGNIWYVSNITDKKILAGYYAASDVFLFTSLAENCPLVVLEAMACGLPIVSFDVGGVPEIVVHKQNGYIATYKDPVDLGRGLHWLLKMKAVDLRRLARANRERAVRRFAIETMVDNYEKIIRE